jgi:hypothetical protein
MKGDRLNEADEEEDLIALNVGGIVSYLRNDDISNLRSVVPEGELETETSRRERELTACLYGVNGTSESDEDSEVCQFSSVTLMGFVRRKYLSRIS